MYPYAGPGQRVDVYVKDDRERLHGQYDSLYKLPPAWGGQKLEEVKSDLAGYGLRKFRDRRSNSPVLYLRIENMRIKYFTYCDNNELPPTKSIGSDSIDRLISTPLISLHAPALLMYSGKVV